eukprot:TRINITY_DN28386_c0_g2_i1.p1 TRINITY_DN28386_c0_g2~~TRINITY_DN28386_c0_g2_i1.p1  ORF type:complete len:938 (+),score=120.51 TRINITY_DN28386_c0_g2_i1:69-2882(+)
MRRRRLFLSLLSLVCIGFPSCQCYRDEDPLEPHKHSSEQTPGSHLHQQSGNALMEIGHAVMKFVASLSSVPLDSSEPKDKGPLPASSSRVVQPSTTTPAASNQPDGGNGSTNPMNGSQEKNAPVNPGVNQAADQASAASPVAVATAHDGNNGSISGGSVNEVAPTTTPGQPSGVVHKFDDLNACNNVSDAMSSVTQQVPKSVSPDGKACIVPIKRDACMSQSPFWVCRAQSGACWCWFSTACHGVMEALQPANGFPLLCGPSLVDHNVCRCVGYDSCPADSGVWNCAKELDGDDSMKTFKGQARAAVMSAKGNTSDGHALQDKLLQHGVCRCKSSGALYRFRLSPAEVQALQANKPLEAFGHVNDKVGISGMSITPVNDGKGRDVFLLSDAASKQGTPQQLETSKAHGKVADAVIPTKGGGDATEKCVVTTGQPFASFGPTQWFILLASMLPTCMTIMLVCSVKRSAQMAIDNPEAHLDDTVESVVAEEVDIDANARPSSTFQAMCALTNIILRLNVTSVLSNSHVLLEKAFQNSSSVIPDDTFLMLSGAFIGAAPVGGVIGLMFIVRSRLAFPREGCILTCLFVFVGNCGILFAMGRGDVYMMLFFRVITGLGEGSQFVCQTYLAKLTAPAHRTEVFGIFELGTAVGLVSGPFVTSMSKGPLGDSGGLIVTVGVSFAAFVLMIAIFPSNESLDAAGVEADEVYRPCWMLDVKMSAVKWIAASVMWSAAATRLLLRLMWESSAVLVLAEHFCLGYEFAGYGASSVVCLHVFAQSLFVKLCAGYSEHKLLKVCETVEILGVLLMLRWPQQVNETIQNDIRDQGPAFIHIVTFTIGSFMFYSGNCMSAAPMTSWSSKHGPRSSCVMFYNHIAILLGISAGATLSRMIAGVDPHQNVLVTLLLPVVFVQSLLVETGFRSISIGKDDTADECSSLSSARTR